MRPFLALVLSVFTSVAAWSADVPPAPPAPKPGAAAEASATPAVVTDPSKVTVTVTPSGTKYHTKDCKSAKAGSEETLQQALAAGLGPCGICHPPVYDPTTIVVFDGGDNGKKYHAKGCTFAKTQTTLAQAQTNGLEPCKICNPPPLPASTKPTTPPEGAHTK